MILSVLHAISARGPGETDGSRSGSAESRPLNARRCFAFGLASTVVLWTQYCGTVYGWRMTLVAGLLLCDRFGVWRELPKLKESGKLTGRERGRKQVRLSNPLPGPPYFSYPSYPSYLPIKHPNIPQIPHIQTHNSPTAVYQNLTTIHLGTYCSIILFSSSTPSRPTAAVNVASPRRV